MGAMSDRTFCKAMVFIANELLRDHGDLDAAIIVVNKIKPGYFDDEVWDDLFEDPLHKESLLQLAANFDKYGVLNEVKPTMTEAEA